jgi:hypothetical protein
MSISSNAILIPDSDDDDNDHMHEKGKGKQPGPQPIPPIGNVIVISDSNDDNALPQKPYPSSPFCPHMSSPHMPATPLKGTHSFKPLFPDGYSPSEFFTTNGSPSAPNVSLQAHRLEKEIEKYMKTPPTDPQVKSTTRRAAKESKSLVNSNTASTLTHLWDSGEESDYGIAEFNDTDLQEIDMILDSLI